MTVRMLQVTFATESNSLRRCCVMLRMQLQLDPFRSVGILGFNSPEWHISNLAAIFAGYVCCTSLVQFSIQNFTSVNPMPVVVNELVNLNNLIITLL